ncbi:MAG: CHASE3 domain-containing protein [Burkholderiales bacterium]
MRPILILTLVLSLLGCATVSAPPGGVGAIARLSPDELERMMPKPNPALPLAELVGMSKAGATAKDIIARIRETGSRYDLSASQAIELHGEGVSAEVLDYIQSARAQELRDRVAEEINQRERRHAEELRREQELRRDNYYLDPWWPGYPGYGWNYGYPFFPHGGFYWRR